MKINFTKMHGLGNDFILIDCRKQKLSTLPSLSNRICDRRFGIGADQLLLLYASKTADFRMRIFNADGSEVEMCGNGIRCFAKYIWENGISKKKILAVETLAGIIRPEKKGKNVKVDMGEPILEGKLIPVDIEGRVVDYPVFVKDKTLSITCVSMGNPHAVIFVDKVEDFPVTHYGPALEKHKLFPKRTNVEFIEIVNSSEIKMRVWERGTGETMACGTGACAASVASNLKGFTGRKMTVHLTGGNLLIEWAKNNHVYMTGPAVKVFQGSIEINRA